MSIWSRSSNFPPCMVKGGWSRLVKPEDDEETDFRLRYTNAEILHITRTTCLKNTIRCQYLILSLSKHNDDKEDVLCKIEAVIPTRPMDQHLKVVRCLD